MDKTIDKLLDEIIDTKDKTEEILKFTPVDLMTIEGMKKMENPFEMIDVKAVMEDLDICKNIAYKLFQRADFPSITIGKNYKVMRLAYIIWKMNKRV